MTPQPKNNHHSINFAPQPEFSIKQSLEIFHNLAEAVLQIVSAVSHTYRNDHAAFRLTSHVQSNASDGSCSSPRQKSHTTLFRTPLHAHVRPNPQHLVPDTLHQPLSPPTPQAQRTEPEREDPLPHAAWSLPSRRNPQERADHRPAGDRSRSLPSPRQVVSSQSRKFNLHLQSSCYSNLTTEEEDRSRQAEVSANPTPTTDDSETCCPATQNSVEKPDLISTVRRSSSNDDIPDLQSASSASDDDSVEQPTTSSADQSSSPDDDLPNLQSCSSDSDDEEPLTGRFWNDSHEDDQSDTEVTRSPTTNPSYWSAPYAGPYDTPEEQDQFMNHPPEKPCHQKSDDYLFKASPTPNNLHTKRGHAPRTTSTSCSPPKNSCLTRTLPETKS